MNKKQKKIEKKLKKLVKEAFGEELNISKLTLGFKNRQVDLLLGRKNRVFMDVTITAEMSGLVEARGESE